MADKNWRVAADRKRPSRARKHSVCIFTEGETESLYFSDFDIPTVRVKCFGLGGGSACHLVQEARAYRRTAQFSGFDQYWVVFDCDDNSDAELRQAVKAAEESRFRWCFSNPCFELWYLLHFVYRDSATTPRELKQRLLPQHVPHYEETMRGMKRLLDSRQTGALKNAETLNPAASRTSWKQRLRHANPSTNVDELVCFLNALAEE